MLFPRKFLKNKTALWRENACAYFPCKSTQEFPLISCRRSELRIGTQYIKKQHSVSVKWEKNLVGTKECEGDPVSGGTALCAAHLRAPTRHNRGNSVDIKTGCLIYNQPHIKVVYGDRYGHNKFIRFNSLVIFVDLIIPKRHIYIYIYIYK